MSDEELKEMMDKTFFVVEATDNERHNFWRDFAHNSWERKFSTICLNWENINPGRMITLGHINKRPIVMTLFWVEIEGKLVMFWELTSQLADYAMAEEWLKKNFHGKWDKGTRIATANSSNFHHCIHAIQEANNGT